MLPIRASLKCKSDGVWKASFAQALHPLIAMCKIRWAVNSLSGSDSPTIFSCLKTRWTSKRLSESYFPSFFDISHVRWEFFPKSLKCSPSFLGISQVRWRVFPESLKCSPSFLGILQVRWKVHPKLPSSLHPNAKSFLKDGAPLPEGWSPASSSAHNAWQKALRMIMQNKNFPADELPSAGKLS